MSHALFPASFLASVFSFFSFYSLLPFFSAGHVLSSHHTYNSLFNNPQRFLTSISISQVVQFNRREHLLYQVQRFKVLKYCNGFDQSVARQQLCKHVPTRNSKSCPFA
jgi:hypothetical protein